MNKLFCCLLITMLVFTLLNLSAETNPLDDMLGDTNKKTEKPVDTENAEELNNDIIMVNYNKKDARLAMLMSAIVPGAGQFYADKSSFTTYISPLIEAAVIGGILYYDKQGNDRSKNYKKYATEAVTLTFDDYTYTGPRYNRAFQAAVQDTLIGIHSQDIYDGLFFSLDDTDTQHFFEDIGKYDKYIFGWVDWYVKYAETHPDINNPDPTPSFVFDIVDPSSQWYNSPENKWRYNIPLVGDPTQDSPFSALRKEYIGMRKDAENLYRTANYLSFGIAFNHILAALDAVRLTSKVNRLYLSDNNIRLNYYADARNGHLTPTLNLTYKF